MPRGVYRHTKYQIEKLLEARAKARPSMLGKHHSEEMKEKNRLAHSGEKAYNWKGDKVGKEALHDWVASRLRRPKLCELCNLKPPRDLANKTGVYSRELINWGWWCRGCHMKYDALTFNVKRGRRRLK